jgi:WD40 repeat protein
MIVSGGSDGTARIWDPATGQERAVLAGQGRVVKAVAITPDGSWLATAGRDGAARIWDLGGTGSPDVTAIRVDGALPECAWFREDTEL